MLTFRGILPDDVEKMMTEENVDYMKVDQACLERHFSALDIPDFAQLLFTDLIPDILKDNGYSVLEWFGLIQLNCKDALKNSSSVDTYISGYRLPVSENRQQPVGATHFSGLFTEKLAFDYIQSVMEQHADTRWMFIDLQSCPHAAICGNNTVNGFNPHSDQSTVLLFVRAHDQESWNVFIWDFSNI